LRKKKRKIMVVDRGLALLSQVQRIFPHPSAGVVFENTMERAFERFEEHTFDILMLTGAAFKLQIDDTIELLEIITTRCPVTQILILVLPKELPLAFSALKAGSYQYAKLPVPDEELRLLVDTALKRRPRTGLNLLLKRDSVQPGFEDMVGLSSPMQEVYRQIRQAAQTDIPVLIAGETGTGKELVARAIHQVSERRTHPFIPITLSALPPELVTSELFGYEKGAFTGAAKRYIGSFERAKRGTIFLDEIGTIDEKNQVSLLRLLETRKFQRISGTSNIRADFRVITATNENLTEAVEQGRFREDLFYRLDVFPINLPRVCERTGDVALLVDNFLKRFNQLYQKNILGVSPEGISRLESHNWPGNVREIKNVIHRAVVMCAGETLLPEHLPKRFSLNAKGPPEMSIRLGSTIEDVEKELILRTLRWAGNNRRRTAAILGIARPTLYSKIKKYRL